MKIIKGILAVLLILLLIIIGSIVVIGWIDEKRTDYLLIEKNNQFQNNSYILKNVNVIPMNQDTILLAKSVEFENGVITKIADHIENDKLSILDGQNQYLLPGLIDMHVTIWDKYELGLYLANGVTSVRNLWGMPYHLQLKELIENKLIIAPDLFTASPKLTGPHNFSIDLTTIKDVEHAKQLIQKYKEDGYDFIKSYAGLSKEIFDAIVQEGERLDFSIVAHPSQLFPYKEHFIPSVKSIQHTEEIVQTALHFKQDSTQLQEIINLYLSNDKAHCPTLTIFHNIIEILEEEENIMSSDKAMYLNPGFREMGSKKELTRWMNEKQKDPEILNRLKDQHAYHMHIVKQLHAAGVLLVCGSDAGISFAAPGFSIHQELAFYHEAGISNYETLKTATYNPGLIHNEFKDKGSIEVGKKANLILCAENPLANLETVRNPTMVFSHGRKIEQTELQYFKSKAYNRQNLFISGIRWIKFLLFEK